MGATTNSGTPTEGAWFADGLRFTCTGCGKCCTGSTGSVSLTRSDLERLAAFFRQPVARFAQKYTRLSKGRRVLNDRGGTHDCVFLTGRSCSVHEARPTQCRTYPWWSGNLQDAESWQDESQVCEGINHPSAPVVPAAEILEQLAIDVANESAITRDKARPA